MLLSSPHPTPSLFHGAVDGWTCHLLQCHWQCPSSLSLVALLVAVSKTGWCVCDRQGYQEYQQNTMYTPVSGTYYQTTTAQVSPPCWHTSLPSVWTGFPVAMIWLCPLGGREVCLDKILDEGPELDWTGFCQIYKIGMRGIYMRASSARLIGGTCDVFTVHAA